MEENYLYNGLWCQFSKVYNFYSKILKSSSLCKVLNENHLQTFYSCDQVAGQI